MRRAQRCTSHKADGDRVSDQPYKKKLIEVALPLDAINAESSAREVDPAWPPLDPSSLVGT